MLIVHFFNFEEGHQCQMLGTSSAGRFQAKSYPTPKLHPTTASE